MNDASPNSIHLAIETTGRHGSLAVMRGIEVLRYTNLSPSERTASSLAPELDRVLKWCRENDLVPEFLSVADGPGSFTGLRIGVTTAKSLSYALGWPLVAVDSLASIAAATRFTSPEVETITVVLDAYRNQVYQGAFQASELLPDLDSLPTTWTSHPSSVRILDNPLWQHELAQLPADTALAGDRKPLGKRAGSAMERQCDAIGTGLLGIRAAMKQQWIDPLQLVPRYLKPSAAEEKLA